MLKHKKAKGLVLAVDAVALIMLIGAIGTNFLHMDRSFVLDFSRQSIQIKRVAINNSTLLKGSKPQAGSVDIATQNSANSGKTKQESQPKRTTTNYAIRVSKNKQRVSADCIVSATLSSYQTSISPEIRKLDDYTSICGGDFITGSMLFTSMPGTINEARTKAVDTAIRLKEFSKHDLIPLVILEPITNAGFINFPKYANGDYDEVMETYFASLRSEGITDKLLGTLVPFPESNIPVWNYTQPEIISRNIVKTAQIQKKYFPNSKTSVLFDSKSYPKNTSWSGGAYTSLKPYVENIPKGLVDSFGLQGYPWPDPFPVHEAGTFLNATYAIEAANTLGAKSIWLSSGTFASGVAWDGNTYTLSAKKRGVILDDIVTQAKKVKRAGFDTHLMLFAQNKSGVAEGIDWSYWHSKPTNETLGSIVFKEFQNTVLSSGIKLWIYDAQI